MKNQIDYSSLIRQLEETGKFKVLHSVKTPEIIPGVLREGERLALIVDTETTGLNVRTDEIVELGILAIAYDSENKFSRLIASYEGMREPTVALSAEAENITGLSRDILKGKSIDSVAVEKLVDRASLIIAHNAAFDRPFCERLFPIFRKKAWACSSTEIPWKKLGYESAKLSYLVYKSGLFYNAHRALSDCVALLNVLNCNVADTSVSPLCYLLESARMPRFLISIKHSFDIREDLKKLGYRWTGDHRRAWQKEVNEGELEGEEKRVNSIEGILQSQITIEKKTAFERFREFNL